MINRDLVQYELKLVTQILEDYFYSNLKSEVMQFESEIYINNINQIKRIVIHIVNAIGILVQILGKHSTKGSILS